MPLSLIEKREANPDVWIYRCDNAPVFSGKPSKLVSSTSRNKGNAGLWKGYLALETTLRGWEFLGVILCRAR
jgi:hypothetical protein